MAKISPPERLRKWRGKRSLRVAAEEIGTDHGHLARLETGDRLPSYALAIRLEKLGVVVASAWEPLRLERARGAQ